jgi:hypothetical protein
LPKKGTLADAENGEDVMIKVAFDCRTAAVRFETEREPSMRRSLSDQKHDEDMLLAQKLWDPEYTTRMVGRTSAAHEMFNITNDWRDKGKAAFVSIYAVTLCGDRNAQGVDIKKLTYF